jgi:amino acid permease
MMQTLIPETASKTPTASLIQTTPLIQTIANAVMTILGSGILSLSWAFYYSTMWPGIVLTVLICFFSASTFLMLGRCSEITGLRHFSDIWSHAFGEGVAWIPDLVTLIFCQLSALSYWIVIGDYLPRGLDGIGILWAPLQERHVAILVVSALILPLNFMKDLSFLGYTSIVGAAATLYTSGVLVLEAGRHLEDQGDWQPCSLGTGIFLMIPTVTFSFTGHFNAPEIYYHLENRSSRRWLLVTIVAFTFCLMITAACGVSGYMMFGSELSLPDRSNVLTSPEFLGRPDVMAAYLATVIQTATVIPLYMQGSRCSLQSLLLRGLPGYNLHRRHHVLAMLCMAIPLSFSMMVESLGIVTAITGAIAASLVMFVFPAAMYLKCAPKATRGLTGVRVLVHRGLPMLSIFTGIIVGVTGVAAALL